MRLLITPTGLDLFMGTAGIIGVLLLTYTVYRVFFWPAFQVMASTTSPPPEVGSVHEIVLRNVRHLRFHIGLVDADLKLRMKGINEDHLVLDFKRDRKLEEYEILVIPAGTVFIRLPHIKTLERMKGRETIQSHEMIGHSATFRLVAVMQGERPIHYIEFEMSSKYFIDNAGDERMKFILELKRIYPGIDLKSRNKKGIYNFGRNPGSEPLDSAGE